MAKFAGAPASPSEGVIPASKLSSFFSLFSSMSDFSAISASAARELASYYIASEWDLVVEEWAMWFPHPGTSTFEKFKEHVKGFMYYNVILCSCESEAEVEEHLVSDYNELVELEGLVDN